MNTLLIPKWIRSSLLLLVVCLHVNAIEAAGSMGADVANVFARARTGEPICCVALGGSITQAGNGWIGPWLQEQFPASDVTMINSGMSATGSALGIFRVERDVIAYQPDLVLIEYCVNDGGLEDEDAVRYMESLVVRLKSLPNPPAIVILEAAAKSGVNLTRHRRVAQHYGLLEVDLQAAVDNRLMKTGETWLTCFKDAVHPNEEGNIFYTTVIEEALTPYLNKPEVPSPQNLPKPLSDKPLILDGRMVALSALCDEDGWQTENSLPHWWDRFFNGVLSAEKPGTSLDLTVRGTTVGLFYGMGKEYGTFYAQVDGGQSQHVLTNTRGGYNFTILAKDLAAQRHRLSIQLPPAQPEASRLNGSVKLGYLLLAGETGATDELGSRYRAHD